MPSEIPETQPVAHGADVPPFVATMPAMDRWMTAVHASCPRIVDRAGSLTFEDVDTQSRAIAKGLLAVNIAKGTRIGLLFPNGHDAVSALFGVTRMGGHAVLISSFAKPRELAYMIRHADIDTLITTDRYLERDFREDLVAAFSSLAANSGPAPLRLAEAPFLRNIWLSGVDAPGWARGSLADLKEAGAALDDAFLEAIEREIVPSDPAVLIYTSGSTAEPKAVVHTHGNVAGQSWRMSRYMTFDRGDRLMNTMPFFWVGGLCTSMLAANLRGAAVVCPDSASFPGMIDAIFRHGVTHAALWPVQMGALIASPGFDRVSARLKPSSAQQLALFGLASPERTPNSLGMTETFGPHSMELFGNPLPEGREHSFGRAVGDIERRIVDPATGLDCAAGEVGELLVRGGALMQGFHRRDRRDVFDADGFYHTGDLASLSADGHLFFRGRIDDLVKTAGTNVSPAEVEAILTAQPEIGEAAVFGIPDPELGQRLIAVVVLKRGAVLDETALIGRLRALVSSYKVPKRIVFLPAAEIPRMGSEKIHMPELSRLVADRLAGSET